MREGLTNILNVSLADCNWDQATLPIHTYKHTYIHTCMHTYIHTYMHTYIHACIDTHTCTYIRKYLYPGFPRDFNFLMAGPERVKHTPYDCWCSFLSVLFPWLPLPISADDRQTLGPWGPWSPSQSPLCGQTFCPTVTQLQRSHELCAL